LLLAGTGSCQSTGALDIQDHLGPSTCDVCRLDFSRLKEPSICPGVYECTSGTSGKIKENLVRGQLAEDITCLLTPAGFCSVLDLFRQF